MPARSWLRNYDKLAFRGDAVAGITLAAYLLPAALGDASLANLPPEAGLYACLFGGLFFWLFCSSRHTAITVTSAISLLIGATLGTIAGGDASRFGAQVDSYACVYTSRVTNFRFVSPVKYFHAPYGSLPHWRRQ